MNQDFFTSLDDRIAAFAQRAGIGDRVRVEIVLANGRVYALDAIVDAAEGWLQFDGHDPLDEEQRISMVLPYHQVSHVLLSRQRVRAAQAGIQR